MLRPSLDESTYLVENDGVADDDDHAGYVMSHERHRDHELRILVRQKLAVVVLRSQHSVPDQRIEDHDRRAHPEQKYNKLDSAYLREAKTIPGHLHNHRGCSIYSIASIQSKFYKIPS